jgi:hypothetical protein
VGFGWVEHFVFPADFCRRMDAILRKQGMKEGSVPVHMTVWNDEADEKSGQLTNRECFEQKKALIHF